MPNLKLDDIVQIEISTTGPATARDTFNVGLIVGKSKHIDEKIRVKLYGSVDAMAEDGFIGTDPEYKAALLYFAQKPAPTRVAIGVCNGNETWADAIKACKGASGDWYACYCAANSGEVLTTAEHQANAAYVETLKAAYFFDDSETVDLEAVNTDVFSTLKKLSYRRCPGLYSKTPYAGAALMGFAMGANNGTAGSAYTLYGKTLVGVLPDDLDETAVDNLKTKNANYYVTRGGKYQLVENGVTANGTWFDEVIGIDQLANDMQLGCMDTITKTKTKIPYTDTGALHFVSACNDACSNALTRGFLAPGIWKGKDVLDLQEGDTLENGYMCMAEPVANQPVADKVLRKCPPIYACLNTAGAIHSVVVKVDVV